MNNSNVERDHSIHLILSGRQLPKQGKNIEARPVRQGLEWKPWRIAACWLALYGFLSLLSYRTQNHLPKGGTPYLDWAYPCQSSVKKMPTGNLEEAFSPLTFLLEDVSRPLSSCRNPTRNMKEL